MDTNLTEKIETHLASIAESLKIIAERTPDASERRLENVFSAILVAAGEEPKVSRAIEQARELETVITNSSHAQ